MAVYFAPQQRDPNAELKYYMMQLAQMLGGKRKETQQQEKAAEFAKSLTPSQIPSAGGESIFTPGGAEALTEGWLGGQPTKTGMIQGAQLSPIQTMQKALTAGLPMNQAIGAARLAPTPKPTKLQELVNEGYTREEARMIRDISHGKEPRASNRKTYDNMSNTEKLAWLSKEKQRAEGQYFGTLQAEAAMEGKGRKIEPRQPKYLKWINKELAKLPMFQTQKTGEPQSQEEFLKTVQSIKDDKEAKAYYDKWVGKWQ